MKLLFKNLLNYGTSLFRIGGVLLDVSLLNNIYTIQKIVGMKTYETSF